MDRFKHLARNLVIFLSLFYLTFYMPMFITTYNDYWYKFICRFHSRCERIGVENAHKKIEELTSYFFHGEELAKKWTTKEKLHLKEVREIFDKMAISAIIAFAILIINRKRVKCLQKFSKINIFTIICFFVVIPFFGKFWRDMFHPLLFDNNLWLNNKFDVSYYIMPRRFFKITVGFILAAWMAINVFMYFYLRNTAKK